MDEQKVQLWDTVCGQAMGEQVKICSEEGFVSRAMKRDCKYKLRQSCFGGKYVMRRGTWAGT